MKKTLLLSSLSLFIIASASAKKVKFAVDMTGQSINTTGVHVWGDFQLLAGYIADWTPNATMMTQEISDTNIYSVVVDIPAFAKYEYTFLNGDQGYDAEFVPIESRVGYDFNTNRWLYIDSLADDTTFVGAIMFAGNAPIGLTLIRPLVNMQFEASVSANGVHVGGTWEGWNPSTVKMYSFIPNVYEIIQYVTAGTWNYKFYNGNTTGDGETITGSCSVFGNREITVSSDIILPTVCFGGCSDCTVGINEITQNASVKVSPNPFHDYAIVRLNDATVGNVMLSDFTGRVIRTYADVKNNQLRIEKNNLPAGIYFISEVGIYSQKGTVTKLVVE